MRAAGGGVIVNVASESSFMGERMYVAYCASKGGVLMLTRALAAELAPTVRVNAVCPGSVDTPMLRRDFASLPDPEWAMDVTRRRIALGRFATPDEVAAAIMFLAAEATFATGLGLNLDGGNESGAHLAGRSRSARREKRFSTWAFLTAMASARLLPTMTTRRLPRVIAV